MAQGDITPPKETTSGGIFAEWKKASPKEKMLILAGVGIVIVIMLYLYNKSKQSQAATTTAGGAGTSGGAGGIQTVPGPNNSQIPIIPSGLCANYDPQGNLINYAPCGTASGGGGSSPGGGGGLGGVPNPPPVKTKGPPSPPSKTGTVGKPALPARPLYPHPVPRQSTTTATTASRRRPTGAASTPGVTVTHPGAPVINRGSNRLLGMPGNRETTAGYGGSNPTGLAPAIHNITNQGPNPTGLAPTIHNITGTPSRKRPVGGPF